jgi:hypothetical protein
MNAKRRVEPTEEAAMTASIPGAGATVHGTSEKTK